jgi:hypothetical protein
VAVAGALMIAVLAADAAGATSFSIRDAQRLEGGGARAKIWWSFTVPAGETATFTVPATGVRDLGLALFSANSSAGELVCKDSSGPAGAETAMAANPGGSPVTVYVQVFAAIAGHEGAYTLNVSSTAPP